MVAAEFNAELKDDKTLPTSTAAKKPKLQSGITLGNFLERPFWRQFPWGAGFLGICRDFMGQPNQRMDNGASGQRFNKHSNFQIT